MVQNQKIRRWPAESLCYFFWFYKTRFLRTRGRNSIIWFREWIHWETCKGDMV